MCLFIYGKVCVCMCVCAVVFGRCLQILHVMGTEFGAAFVVRCPFGSCWLNLSSALFGSSDESLLLLLFCCRDHRKVVGSCHCCWSLRCTELSGYICPIRLVGPCKCPYVRPSVRLMLGRSLNSLASFLFGYFVVVVVWLLEGETIFSA